MEKIGTGPKYKKSLGFGKPKGGGKSTFYFHADQPLLVLNYDGGDPGKPPGISSDDIWIQNYPIDKIDIKPGSSDWKRSKDQGNMIIQDIVDIVNQMSKTSNEELVLTDWWNAGGDMTIKAKMPRPKSITLDGMVVLNNAILDWLMADSTWNINDAVDAGKKVQQFYGERLDRLNKLIRWLVQLPCNINFVTWEKDETKKGPDDTMPQPTGKKVPDIGGKLDQLAPGAVDACLYFYSERAQDGIVHYYATTKPTKSVDIIGVRGTRYGLPGLVDVTIGIPENKLSAKMTIGNPAYINPWDRVWGKMEEITPK